MILIFLFFTLVSLPLQSLLFLINSHNNSSPSSAAESASSASSTAESVVTLLNNHSDGDDDRADRFYSIAHHQNHVQDRVYSIAHHQNHAQDRVYSIAHHQNHAQDRVYSIAHHQNHVHDHQDQAYPIAHHQNHAQDRVYSIAHHQNHAHDHQDQTYIIAHHQNHAHDHQDQAYPIAHHQNHAHDHQTQVYPIAHHHIAQKLVDLHELPPIKVMLDPTNSDDNSHHLIDQSHHSNSNKSNNSTVSGSYNYHGSRINPPPQPSVNSTGAERRRWIRANWNSLKILHSDDDLARNFSDRIDVFLAGIDRDNAAQKPKLSIHNHAYHNDLDLDLDHNHHHDRGRVLRPLDPSTPQSNSAPCTMRFFMTWISALSSFGPREHLALESVFKSHPDACLVILSHTFDTPAGAEILRPFVRAGFRVTAITPDLSYLSSSTPASKWLRDLRGGRIDPGHISIGQNLSNLLRLLVLYKYGGTYLDTDVVVTRGFGSLNNTIGAQNADKETRAWTRLNNAVMVFDKRNPLLARFIADFCLTFNGSKWGHNGPYLVTRVVLSSKKRYSNATLRSHCNVLKPIAFYPVDWDHITSFFRAPVDDLEARWVSAKLLQLKRSSYAVHLWNKMSRDIEIEPGSIMDSVFRRVCVFCDNTTLHNALKGITSS